MALIVNTENDEGDQRSELLQEIVATSQLRLLGRLRSKHAPRSKKSPGPSIIILLQKAFKIPKRAGTNANDLNTLREAVTSLSKSFQALEDLSEGHARSKLGGIVLRRIISTISSLNFATLRQFLSQIQPKDFPWTGTPY